MEGAQFPMKRLSSIINCNLDFNMIYAIGFYKLKQRNNPTEASFAVQLNPWARGIRYAVLFHALNAIRKLLSNILEMKQFQNWRDAAAALRRTRLV